MANRHSITFALALLTTPASADVLLPPERYDRPAPNATVVHVPARQVHRECVRLGAPSFVRGYGRIEACSVADERIIVLPTPETVSRKKYACLYRHEAAHIHGWSGDHRGGRQTSEC